MCHKAHLWPRANRGHWQESLTFLLVLNLGWQPGKCNAKQYREGQNGSGEGGLGQGRMRKGWFRPRKGQDPEKKPPPNPILPPELFPCLKASLAQIRPTRGQEQLQPLPQNPIPFQAGQTVMGLLSCSVVDAKLRRPIGASVALPRVRSKHSLTVSRPLSSVRLQHGQFQCHWSPGRQKLPDWVVIVAVLF